MAAFWGELLPVTAVDASLTLETLELMPFPGETELGRVSRRHGVPAVRYRDKLKAWELGAEEET